MRGPIEGSIIANVTAEAERNVLQRKKNIQIILSSEIKHILELFNAWPLPLRNFIVQREYFEFLL